MMGPLLRRKKIVSVPLGSTGDGFFFGAPPPSSGTPTRASVPRGEAEKAGRTRKNSLIGNVIRRKQVSLDLYAPEQADFFGVLVEEKPKVLDTAPDEAIGPATVPLAGEETEDEKPELTEEVKLFIPLRFSPPIKLPGDRHGAHGAAPIASVGPVDYAVRDAFERQCGHNQQLKRQIDMLTDRLEGETDQEQEKLLEDIQATRLNVELDTLELKNKLFGEKKELPKEEVSTEAAAGVVEEDFDDSGIIRATKIDYIWTGILLCIMIAFTGAVVGWETHLDESSSTFGPVGLACATPCAGDLESQDYFNGHSHFETGQFIQLTMQMDPYPNVEAKARVEIVGHDTGHVKAEVFFGPPLDEDPATFVEKIAVDFDDPHEEHIINVYSTNSTVKLTYKLHASTLTHMAKHSELIAALIMIFVYIFILLEVIHRTLVAIFGSLVALLFFFIIHEVRPHETRVVNHWCNNRPLTFPRI
jgi:hypothetical protein